MLLEVDVTARKIPVDLAKARPCKEIHKESEKVKILRLCEVGMGSHIFLRRRKFSLNHGSPEVLPKLTELLVP